MVATVTVDLASYQRESKRIADLDAFVAAYDKWRAAADAFGEVEDELSHEELRPLAEAEAVAEVELIKARNALDSKPR